MAARGGRVEDPLGAEEELLGAQKAKAHPHPPPPEQPGPTGVRESSPPAQTHRVRSIRRHSLRGRLGPTGARDA